MSDESLAAEAAREGSDGPAFLEIVRRFRDPLWRVCYRLMGNPHDASDAAQEVFIRLFVNRATFAGRSKYSTWVHGVALRTCLTLRRGRTRRERRVAPADDAWIETQPGKIVDPAVAVDLGAVLESLDEEDRALLILKYAEGYSYHELAEMFNLSTSACKMRVSRLRERLRTQHPEDDSTKIP
jgi:RNA polymerase sigma-70 factor (ECF subfamily)